MLLDLRYNRGVLDLFVISKHHRFTEYDSHGSVTFKWQENFFRCLIGQRTLGHDTQILIIGFHENIARSQVDFVGSQ